MSHTPAERVLFSDLTQLLLSLRDARLADVEASIEERFRAFVRAQSGEPGGNAASLQIAFTWTLPDGADDWAVYATEYKTLPAVAEDRPQRAAAGGGDASIIAFPASQISHPAPAWTGPARVIAFPG